MTLEPFDPVTNPAHYTEGRIHEPAAVIADWGLNFFLGSAVEIKCPAPATHIGYLLDGFGTDYILQVQGQMLVGGFDFIDRYSYYPELPPYRERTTRDETIIDALRNALRDFNEMIDGMLIKARATGFFDARPVEDVNNVWEDEE